MILKNYLFKSDSRLETAEKKETVIKLSEQYGYPRPLLELPSGFGIVKNFNCFTKDRIYVNTYNDLSSITFFNPPMDISEKIDAVVIKFNIVDIDNIFNSYHGIVPVKININVSLMTFDMNNDTYISPILKIRLKLLKQPFIRDIDYIFEITKNKSSFSFYKKYLGVIHDKNNNDVFKLMVTKLK